MAFVHYELNTSDPTKAKKFYKSVFGWKTQDMKMPTGVYTMLQGPNGPFGGLQKNPMDGAPSHWLAYANVASIDRALAKASKAGGTVIVPKIEVPGMGKYAVLTDPQGAVVGLWQAAPPAKPKKKSAKKKAAKKRSSKKRTTKKRTTKKSTKKRTTKKRTTKKRAAKKRAAKKSTKRRATKKRTTKKRAKKAAKKRSKKK